MLDYRVPAAEIDALRAAHRSAREKRVADRIKAVVLLASSWTAEDVAAALLVDPNTVRNHYKRYKRGRLPPMERENYAGSEELSTREQLDEFDAHLQQELHSSAASVARSVKERVGAHYSDNGMTP